MPFSIYDTYYMLAAIEDREPEHTFFKSRYFPTNQNLDVFGTTKVLIDYKSGKRRMADFVMPRVGPISVGREGFSTYELEPANIAISRPLTLDQLTNRGFGESLMTNMKPEERANMLLMEDLTELSMRITRREEWLSVNTMLENGCTMLHVTENPDVKQEVKAQFYDGVNNPAEFIPDEKWTHSEYKNDGWVIGNWYKDICSMIRMLTHRGLPASDILVSPDVGEFIIADPWVVAMMDNRRFELGSLNPSELTTYVTALGSMNFGGRRMTIYISEGTYEDDTGKDTPYMPEGTVIVTAPGCGKGLYGAVTQMERDEEFHTYVGTRIPQRFATIQPPQKELVLRSRPLYVPRNPSPWSVAKKVFLPDP